LVSQELREVIRIERKAPFLDDQVIAVQEGADAWCYEPGVSGRVWCMIVQPSRFTLSDGNSALLARLV
jgi:hypothetical protein